MTAPPKEREEKIMPINSVIITSTAEEEQSKTYFIQNCEKTIFVHTTFTKIKTLINILEEFEVVEEWGELKDYCGIYEF